MRAATWVFGTKTRLAASESTTGLMANALSATGRTVSWMAMAIRHGQTVDPTSAISKKTKSTGTEPTPGAKTKSTLDAGIKANSMAMDDLFSRTDDRSSESGSKARNLELLIKNRLMRLMQEPLTRECYLTVMILTGTNSRS